MLRACPLFEECFDAERYYAVQGCSDSRGCSYSRSCFDQENLMPFEKLHMSTPTQQIPYRVYILLSMAPQEPTRDILEVSRKASIRTFYTSRISNFE